MHQRHFRKVCIPLCMFVWVCAAAVNAQTIALHWLDASAPAVQSGVSFGVPWPRGKVQKNQTFSLTTADGRSLPLQSWPLAYWPDGSMKWTGFSTVAGPEVGSELRLSPGQPSQAAASVVRITEGSNTIDVDTGPLQCRISKQGANLIDSLSLANREVAKQGSLVCILQNGSDGEPESSPQRQRFQSSIQKSRSNNPAPCAL